MISFRTIKDRVSSFCQSDASFIVFCAFGFAYFYFIMARSGILTHDELQALAYVREGSYFERQIGNYLALPRGFFIVDVFTQFPQYSSPDNATYRIFDIIAIICANYCLYRFVRLIASKRAARVSVILFFITAYITNSEHNGFISFGWSYKYHVCFFFIVLELLIRYVRSDRRGYLVASVVLYVFSSGLYESFVLLCVPIALVGIYESRRLGKLSWPYLIRTGLPYAIAEAAYLGVYLYVTSHASGAYGGTDLAADLSLPVIVDTTLTYMTGLMPFAYEADGPGAFVRWLAALSPSSLTGWVVTALFVSYLIATLRALGREEHDVRALAAYAGILLVSAFFITLPFGLSVQYVYWAQETGVRGYGCSLYSYFIIVSALTALICAGISLASTRARSIALLSVLGCAATVVSLHSAFNNVLYSNMLSYNHEKYTLFDGFIRSAAFAQVEDGRRIFAPDYIGIHFNMGSLSEYAEGVAGKQVEFANDPEAADYDYELRIDRSMDLSLLYGYDYDPEQRLSSVDIVQETGSVSISHPDGEGIVVVPAEVDDARQIAIEADD